MELILKKRVVFAIAAIVVLFKLLLAGLLPVTGDEAYYALWSSFPGIRFYDYPPVAGWMMTYLSGITDTFFFYRLTAVFSTVLIAVLFYLYIRKTDKEKAGYILLIILLSPYNLLNVFITTDAPQIIFAFLSGLVFLINREKNTPEIHILNGALLGAAYLSKYFAALLLLSYAVFFLLQQKKDFWKPLVLTIVGAMPFIILHIIWNYQNCWGTFIFSVFAHDGNTGFSATRFLSFLGMQLYLGMPWFFWWVARAGKDFWKGRNLPLALMFFLPLTVFALFSLVTNVGLNWMLAFYPFFYLMLTGLETDKLRKGFFATATFGMLHVAIGLVLITVSGTSFKYFEKYPQILFYTDTDRICSQLEQYADNYTIAAINYDPAAVLSFHCDRYVINFADVSKYGRYDDKITDYRALDGKNIVTFSYRPLPEDELTGYFDNVTFTTLTLEGAEYPLAIGNGFKYNAYKEGNLATLKERFYTAPEWLPSAACTFDTRYFTENDNATEGIQ